MEGGWSEHSCQLTQTKSTFIGIYKAEIVYCYQTLNPGTLSLNLEPRGIDHITLLIQS